MGITKQPSNGESGVESGEAVTIAKAFRLGGFWHTLNMPCVNLRKYPRFYPLSFQKTLQAALKQPSCQQNVARAPDARGRSIGRRWVPGMSGESGLTFDVHPSFPVMTCDRIGSENQIPIPPIAATRARLPRRDRLSLLPVGSRLAGWPCNGRIGRLTVN